MLLQASPTQKLNANKKNIKTSSSQALTPVSTSNHMSNSTSATGTANRKHVSFRLPAMNDSVSSASVEISNMSYSDSSNSNTSANSRNNSSSVYTSGTSTDTSSSSRYVYHKLFALAMYSMMHCTD
jgi:hypothetical protein